MFERSDTVRRERWIDGDDERVGGAVTWGGRRVTEGVREEEDAGEVGR